MTAVTAAFGGGIPKVFLISGVPNALRTDLEDNVVLVVSMPGGFEENENEEENAHAQKKTKESVKTMSQLKKLSSTNAAGVRESVNLPKRRSQKLTLPAARQKYQAILEELSIDLDEYLTLHKPQEFIQEDERPEANKRFKRMKN